MRPVARRTDECPRSPLLPDSQQECNLYPVENHHNPKEHLAVMEIGNILNAQRGTESHPIEKGHAPEPERSSSQMRLFHDDLVEGGVPERCLTPPLRASNPVTMDQKFAGDDSFHSSSPPQTTQQSELPQKSGTKGVSIPTHQRLQKHRSTELGLFKLSPPIMA